MAGAIIDKVDVQIAPRSAAKMSTLGTATANPSEKHKYYTTIDMDQTSYLYTISI